MTKDGLNLASEFAPATDSAWRALVEKTLKGKDFDRVMTSKSYDDISINALYTKDSMVQGPRPQTRNGEWLVSAAHWNRDAEQTNQAIMEDLERGVSALAIRIASGAFTGVAASDLAKALEGVYLNMVGFNLIPGEEFEASSREMLNFLQIKGHDKGEIKGCLGIDPIGTLAQSGRLLTTTDEALAQSTKIAVGAAEYPNLATFMAEGTPYHNAGGTEAQELGLMLSTAVTYLRAMEKAGIDLQVAAKNIHFTVAADTDVYLTVAKLRAARLLWQQVLTACGLGDIPMHLSAVSSLRMMTVKDPWVNILRGTSACFGAAIGGADSICVMPHDLMLGMSSKFARRIARNIQIILQEESSLSKVVDPAAGAFSFETITSDLVAKAWKYFQKIENDGGIVAKLKTDSLQIELTASWDKKRLNLAKRKDAVTGISEFPNIHEDEITDIEPLHSVESIKPAGMTVTPIPFHRLAEEYETLRSASDVIEKQTDKRPKIFLANLGTAADFTGRSTFAKNYFEAGGIEAVGTEGFEQAADLVNAYKEANTPIAIVCSSDGKYVDAGPDMVRALKEAGAVHVYLAGKPKNSEELTTAGVGTYIYMGSNVLATLENAYKILGENS